MRKLIIAMIVFEGVAGFAQQLDKTPEVTLPLMSKVPKIDGVIDEAEWKGAARMERFCEHGGPLFPAEATFRVGSDGKKLFIAVSGEVGPDGLRQRVVPNPSTNAMAWLDDNVEIVVAPDLKVESPKIFHSILTNRGAQYSQAKKGNEPFPWRGNWELKGVEKDGRWNLELALPLSEVGVEPGASLPATMGLRICRNWKNLVGGQKRTTAWEPIRAAYFDTFAIPVVNWDEAAPVVQLVQLKDSPEATEARLKLSVHNPSNKPLEAKVNYALKPKNSAPESKNIDLDVKPGETEIVDLPGREPLNNESFDTLVEVTSPDGAKTYYRRAFEWQSVRPEKIFADKDGGGAAAAFFQFAYFPSFHKMVLELDLNGLDDVSQVKGIESTILGPDGKEVAKTAMPPLKNKISRMIWNIPDLAEIAAKNDGSAEFTVVLELEGVKDGQIKRTFQRTIMPWEATTLGKSEEIIVPPFTPIKVEGMDLSTILRTHRLNKLGLWSQVTAADQPLLKDGGMRLEATIGGKPTAIKVDSFEFTETKPHRVKTASVWRAGALSGTTEATWDYDGVMKWILKINPCAETVDSLKLIIPLDDEKSPLFHACADGIRFNYGGATPKGEGKVWDGTKAPRNSIIGSYVPYIWAGDELRGVSVFGENDKGWTTSDEKPCQELLREGENLKLVLNLIAAPTTIDEPREILLGFQATPIKPMPKDWRKWNAWSWRGNGMIDFERCFTFLGSCYYWGALTPCLDLYPVGKDVTYWKELAKTRKTGTIDKEFVKEWKKVYVPFDGDNEKKRELHEKHVNGGFHLEKGAKNKEVMFYTNARGVRFDTPEGRTFVDEWYRMPFISRKFKPGQGVAYDLDPVESFRDYAMWWYKRMFETGACDQIYWDDVFMQSDFNLVGTAAYQRPDGTTQPASGVFDMRELVRRTAILQAEMDRPSRNMCHMTNTAIAPILSFARMNYDWEDHGGDKDFQDRYSKEYIRTLSIGRQFGNYPVVLAPVKGDEETLAWCLRTAVGVMLTHETRWSANHQFYWDMVKILYDFGYGEPDVEVFNYWDEDYPIQVVGPDSSSLVLKKNGKVMVVVCDYGGDGEFKLVPNLEKLGLTTNFMAVNAETGEPLKVENGQVIFPLKKHDFIIVVMKNPGEI